MPSHAYFYASTDNPFRDVRDEPLVDTPRERAVRERIIDGLEQEFGESTSRRHFNEGYASMFVGGLELLCTSRYLHVRLPWLSHAECERRKIVPTLRRIERVLHRTVGFDAFEHGCQGLHMPGDIDLVPHYLAGTQGQLAKLFAAAAAESGAGSS